MVGAGPGHANLLTNKGSVYDLAAIYTWLIDKKPDNTEKIVDWFSKFLNLGHSYEAIRNEILGAFYDNRKLNIQIFKTPYNKEDRNIIIQGEIYYHKELKIMAKPPTINLDIEKGTMVSSKQEYFLEQRASYTIKDLVRYFYSRGMADVSEYNYHRMKGFLLFKVKQFGIDMTLFMLEAMYRDFISEQKAFNINHFDDYIGTAKHFMEDAKNNSSEPYYVQRIRDIKY